MQLSVFGLGNSGAVVAACLVSQGHDVIAADRNAGRVDLIRRGLAPVSEPGLDELIGKAVQAGKLTATGNVAHAVAQSVLSSICLPMPVQSRHARDLVEITDLCTQIGTALAAKAKFHAIVLRTALPSGAVRDVLIPTLERASGKQAGIDFGVAVYPAFLRRGSAIHDCTNPPAILLGVTDDETLARVREMEIALQAPEMVVDLDEAEAMMSAGGGWPEASAPDEKNSMIFPGFAMATGNLRSY